ncbi:MAG: hypothetical protein KY461_14075, partial [Actinobacteria bacterium]|nr:hypothetical protein [Actinomycetota bacterium]
MDGTDDDRPTGDEPVVVASSGSRVEAMIAVTALEDAGHVASLLSDDAGGLHPEMSWLYQGAYRVVVPPAEAERARAYLAELDAGDHAFPDDGHDPADRDEGPGRGLGLDGRRRGWIAVAVALVAIFLVFRLVDSATSFG